MVCGTLGGIMLIAISIGLPIYWGSVFPNGFPVSNSRFVLVRVVKRHTYGTFGVISGAVVAILSTLGI